MLLSALKTKVENIAERTIANATFLTACEAVVRDIESRDYRLQETENVTEACDGSDTYLSIAGVDKRKVVRVSYVITGEAAKSVDLVEVDGLEAPPTNRTKVSSYDWIGAASIQLDGRPASGSLSFDLRSVPTTLALTDDVPYEPMLSGVLAWLGKMLWKDSRREDWETSFEAEIKALLVQTLVASSKLTTDGGLDAGLR